MKLLSKLFDRTPKIETERLILRHMRVSDASDMYEYACLPEVTRYLLWSPHESLGYTRDFLSQIEEAYKKNEFHDFGIILKENRKFIGTCGFAELDMANFKGEVGYVLNPDYWGRGIACEAVNAVLRLGFDRMGLNRIEARYMLGNDRSRRVMERCGMQFEGIQRQAMFVKKGFCDIGICAILARDYAPTGTEEKFTNI
ncbi:MAG: GNAT family N-acetyltransferase [Ruminococcaceae bacterium]|nr:GNAT family N-acetyltransferase [Oscillospiraceae bacterium]